VKNQFYFSNIYSQGELSREATVRKFRTVRKEGNRMVYRNIDYYNLNMIISVGFRVNSRQGILFGLMLNDIFKEGKLEEKAVCKESLHTAADGKNIIQSLTTLML
jgi:hypothetical protein